MRIPVVVIAVLLAPPGVRADAPAVRSEAPVMMPPVEVTEAKTHTLFMGADIAVNLDRDAYPVRNVIGSNWVVLINNENHEISSKQGTVDLRITPKLKLAEGEATILGFDRKAAYSYANDPSVRLTQGLTRAAVTTAMLIGVANDAQAKADTSANTALGGAATLAQSDQVFGADAMMHTAQVAGATLNFHGQAGAGGLPPTNLLAPNGLAYIKPKGWDEGVGLYAAPVASAKAETASAGEPTGRIATQGLDAMDIDFSISSPRPLHEPYVVTIAKFHPAGAKPGMVQNLIYAAELAPIDAHPSHVHFTEEGFPFDYELLDFQMHLYDRGIEVATNLSAKHVELTRAEAFEYIKMEYLGAHPDDTVPPEPALGHFPAQLPVYLHQGRYAQTFFVRVTKDGKATAAFADLACRQRIDDPFLEAVVAGIWFKPALDRGKPVEGLAAVNLTKLTI